MTEGHISQSLWCLFLDVDGTLLDRDALGRWHSQNGFDVVTIARARERLQQSAARFAGTTLVDRGIAVALNYRQVPQLEDQIRNEARAIVRAFLEELADCGVPGSSRLVGDVRLPAGTAG